MVLVIAILQVVGIVGGGEPEPGPAPVAGGANTPDPAVDPAGGGAWVELVLDTPTDDLSAALAGLAEVDAVISLALLVDRDVVDDARDVRAQAAMRRVASRKIRIASPSAEFGTIPTASTTRSADRTTLSPSKTAQAPQCP